MFKTKYPHIRNFLKFLSTSTIVVLMSTFLISSPAKADYDYSNIKTKINKAPLLMEVTASHKDLGETNHPVISVFKSF